MKSIHDEFKYRFTEMERDYFFQKFYAMLTGFQEEHVKADMQEFYKKAKTPK
jgi:hypothetical protein